MMKKGDDPPAPILEKRAEAFVRGALKILKQSADDETIKSATAKIVKAMRRHRGLKS